MIALGENNVIIPVALLDDFLQLVGSSKRSSHLLFAIFVPEHFFAARGHDAAGHAFFVKDASVRRSGFHIGLVTADNPIGGIQDFAAILDPGIGKAFAVIGGESERASQLEIAYIAIGPDEERIPVGRIFFGRLTGDSAIFDRPEPGVARPTGEIGAIK